jgi:hypothetical protein
MEKVKNLDEQRFEKKQPGLCPVQFADARFVVTGHLQKILGSDPVECHQTVDKDGMEKLRLVSFFQRSVRGEPETGLAGNIIVEVRDIGESMSAESCAVSAMFRPSRPVAAGTGLQSR